MARTITLKYSAICKECKADLEAGSKARYYGPGQIYGTTCHVLRSDNRRTPNVQRALRAAEAGNYGLANSIMDPRGVYNGDGDRIGTVGPRCEDAPCCGCCS